MEDKLEFAHLRVAPETHRKVVLLAAVRGGNIYKMVGDWADEAWAQALKTGLVNNAMIGQADKSATTKKGVKA